MRLPEHLKQVINEVAQEVPGAFYFYDLQGLRQHLSSLAQECDARLWYACKANPLSSILQTVKDAGLSFDCAGHGEIHQVLSQRVGGESIITTGPAKSERYFSIVLKQGVRTFVIESPNQLKWLEKWATRYGVNVTALLRVQLQWEDSSKNVLGGEATSAFGVDQEEWKEIDLSSLKNVDVMGLHVFQWGNLLSVDRLHEIWRESARQCSKLAKGLGIELRVLDLGGGLGIPYSEKQSPLSWKEVVQVFPEIKAEYSIGEIWLELGRYAVGEYGHYVTEVYDRKRVFGHDLLILDSGVNHMMRPAITGEPFPVEMLRKSDASTQTFHLHGPLCTAIDQLGRVELPSDVEIGDRMVFSQCGAYGFTESMPFFLCHELPAEVVYDGTTWDVIRPIEQPTSWLR